MDLDAEPSPPTAIHLPPSLPYPITLTSLFTPVSAQVTKGTKALSYTYTLKDDLRDGADVNTTDNKKRKGEEKGFATWEVPIDGEVSQWAEGVKVGSVIKNARSAFRPKAGSVMGWKLITVRWVESQSTDHLHTTTVCPPCSIPRHVRNLRCRPCFVRPTFPSPPNPSLTRCCFGNHRQEYTTPSASTNSARNANPAANQGGAGNGQGGVEIEHNESGVKVSFEVRLSGSSVHVLVRPQLTPIPLSPSTS